MNSKRAFRFFSFTEVQQRGSNGIFFPPPHLDSDSFTKTALRCRPRKRLSITSLAHVGNRCIPARAQSDGSLAQASRLPVQSWNKSICLKSYWPTPLNFTMTGWGVKNPLFQNVMGSYVIIADRGVHSSRASKRLHCTVLLLASQAEVRHCFALLFTRPVSRAWRTRQWLTPNPTLTTLAGQSVVWKKGGY